MISIKNIKLLAFTTMVIMIALLSACEKDTAESIITVPEKTTLESFGPTGALHGDTLRIIGYHLDRVTEVDLTGATIPAASFISKTSDLILIIIPNETVAGYITLKSSDGDITSKTILNLEVIPTITSMTAEARPGTNITLKGNHLNWITSITFAKDLVQSVFVSQSISELVVKVPDNAQSGKLVINYNGTKPGFFETTNSLAVTLPVATGFAPNPVKHQTNLTITGTNLDLTKEIKFSGVNTPVSAFESKTATQIVVKIPASTTKGKVGLIANSGVNSVSSQDLDVLLPTIASLSPNPIDPLANLTITGTNLDLVTGISFTGIPAAVTTFVSKTPTQLVVTVPTGTLKGKPVLSVLNSTLTVESATVLDIKGGLAPLADFPFPIYTDATQNTFQDWSYTDVHDFNNTSLVRQGTTSIKAVYAAGGYQGITFHAGTGAATGAYTKLEFSIFAETGTGGKKLNVVINGNYGAPAQVTLIEGEWTTFSLTLSSLGNPNPLNEIVLQSAGWGGVLHIDHVGLR